MALFELTEIVFLGNADPNIRKVAKQMQALILEHTKNKHNLLPHEGVSSEKSKDHPLLPRFDVA